jgi:hypothetical protein
LLQHAQSQGVHQHPGVDHLTVDDPVDDDTVNRDKPSGCGNAREFLLMGAGPVEPGGDVFAVGDLLLVGPDDVGEGGEPAGKPRLQAGPAGARPGPPPLR